MIDGGMGRQVVGLVNQAGLVMGHALLDPGQVYLFVSFFSKSFLSPVHAFVHSFFC